jgi:Zn finger protein HypA/HybF involved in hydrogenase expression
MRTWIINIPVDLSDFLLLDHGSINHYLAVNKHTDSIMIGDIAFLWGGRHSKSPGIMGYGMITTAPLKPTEIPKKYRKLYDSGSLQVGFRAFNLAYYSAIIPETYAYRLPSLNETKQATRIKRKTVYWGWWLHKEFQIFEEDFRHFYDAGDGIYNEQYFHFTLHLLREKYFTEITYKKFKTKLSRTPLICTCCKIDFEKKLGRKLALTVLELHENPSLTQGDYEKIKPENFSVICPTCHKIEHEKIKNGEE